MAAPTRSQSAAGASTAAAAASKPRQQQEHSEWQHGPVAAALNASIVSVVAAAAVCLTGLKPWVPLLIGALMSVVLVAAGAMRKPRPLALRSLVYRGTAMLLAGVWMWTRTADFSHVGAGAASGLIMLGVTVACGIAVFAGLRGGHRLFALFATLLGLATGISGTVTALLADITSPFLITAHLGKDNYPGWLGGSALSVGVLAAVYTVFGTVCANHEDDLDDKLERAMMLKSFGREMAYMQALLRDVCRAPNLRVEEYKKWDNGAGEDYIIDGTADGITPDVIETNKDSLASRLNLPLGCGVEAVQGVTRGRIVVAVSRVNRIKDPHVYPAKYRQRSIYNPLPIGVLRDGTEVGISLRESSAFVFGQKRSGKTTTLYDIAAGLCQCTDAMIWVIDFGGGGVALPFLYRGGTPVIDWVATTIDEAQKMADLAYAIASDRKTFYKHRKRKASTNLLPLDAEVPEIVIMIDEGAEAMGETAGMSYEAKQVRAKLEAIVRVAGDSGVNIVFSGLAATGEVIDRLTLAQMAIRIGMRVTEGRELAYGFDSDYGLNPADIPYQGSGFVKASHEEGTRVFKAYLLEPDQMYEIAEVTADWRPELDDRGKELGGEMYARRWERTRHLLMDEHGNLLVDVNGAATGTAVMDRPTEAPKPPKGSAWATPPNTGGGAGGLSPDEIAAAGAGPVTPGAGGLSDDEMKEARRQFEVPGSVDDVLRRADDTAQRLNDVAREAKAADGGADEDDELADDPRVRQFRAQLDHIDWTNPSSWPELPPPPRVEAERNPQGPAVLESLVRHHGPDGISAKDIKEKLRMGGPWGPPIMVSDQTVHEWLAPGKVPASWLARRQRRMPYVHKEWGPPPGAVAA